jgi:multidrug resistance protein
MRRGAAAATAPGPGASSNRSTLGIVFTTILLDFIGFSVLIPVLPIYATRLGATSFEVGLILSLYAAAQLVFLPVWGWLSDRVGRRPVILISLLGTVASFLLLASGDSLATIYVARILAGFFAASIGTAQAVVTDVTPDSKRAQGMGMIGAAFGLGFVLGPALGGWLSAFDERAPFYGIAVLAFLNLVVAFARLPESHPPERRRRDLRGLARTLVPTPLRFLVAHHDRRIGRYLFLFFQLFTAFAALEAMFSVYLNKRFSMQPLEVGYVFAVIGVSIALTQGVLIRRLAPWLGEVRLVVIGLVVQGAGLGLIPLVSAPEWLYLVGPVIAVGNGLWFPSFTALYSRACHTENAGELMGESSSMATTGRIVGPLWAGLAMDRIDLGAPFVLAGGLTFAALALFWLWRETLLGDAQGPAAS